MHADCYANGECVFSFFFLANHMHIFPGYFFRIDDKRLAVGRREREEGMLAWCALIGLVGMCSSPL